jgi:hypothetical protein
MSNQTKQNLTQSRRGFLAASAASLAAMPLAAQLLTACNDSSAPLPPGAQALKEEEATATALGYKADASKVDDKRFPKRAGSEGTKQFCKNCSYYTPKNEGWGECQILRAGLVTANGWCNTWNAKPGT